MPDKRELQIRITAQDNASKELNKIGGIIEKNKAAIRAAGVALTAFGAAATVGLKSAVDEAKIAEGSYNKFNTVFGQYSEDMMDFVNNLRKEMPMATHEIARLAADMQDLLVPLGLSRGLATDMSKGFLDVANKIAAFNDVEPSEVLEAIKSGLAGSAEPLKRFGVNALETALEARALKEGLLEAGQGFKDLDPEVKMQIRAQALLGQIVDNSSDAISGFEANNDSLLRRQQDLTASIKELKKSIGDGLIPVVDSIVKKLIPVVKNIMEWAQQNPELAKGIALVVGILGALAVVIGPILIMLPGLSIAIGALGAAFTLLTGPVGLVIAIIAALIAIGVLLYKNWDHIANFLAIAWDKIKKVFEFGIAFIKGLIIAYLDWLVPTWREDLEKIKVFFDLLWEGAKLAWEGITQVFTDAWNKIKDIVMGVWKVIEVPMTKVGGFLGQVKSDFSAGLDYLGEGFMAIAEKGGFKGFASGGIVTSPTLAMVGEAGPEAIIPLNKMKTSGGLVINITGNQLLDETAGEKIAEQIMSALRLNRKIDL